MAERILLDSSAVLALLRREPVAERVAAVLPQAAISAVNAAEVVAKLVTWGVAPDRAVEILRDLDLPIVPFEAAAADRAGALHGRHRGRLSLGDSACLATAQMLGLPVLTTDRIWAELNLGLEVRLLR